MDYDTFQKRFGTDEQCRQYLFDRRYETIGFVCPKCKHNEYFNIKSRQLYQCKYCNHQFSVTAGTIMDKTRTSLTDWFLAMYLMIDDGGISAPKLQEEIGVSYNTAWSMCHKIREVMGSESDCKTLDDLCEKDEFLFYKALK